MRTQIDFKRLTKFTGRNGYFNMKAVEMMDSSTDCIMISPITSKGNSARCDIEIPKENLQEFIDNLKKFL